MERQSAPNNDIGFLADLNYWARSQLLTRNPFYNYTDALVIIAFKNGYTVEMVLKARSHTFILIKVVDDNGKTIDTDTNINKNSGGSSGSDGSNSHNPSDLDSGCYGSCGSIFKNPRTVITDLPPIDQK